MSILFAGFQETLQWVLQYGYAFLFILMLIEGPVVTAAGAFAAALHYFNIWVVLLLSILANLIPDVVYYALGYWGRHKFIDRYGHYFGLTPERVRKAEILAKKYSWKSLIGIKLIPFLATPGLVLIGAARMNFKKYMLWCILIIIPSSLLYLIIGYYFGAAYTTIDHYLHIGTYLFIGIVAIAVLVIYFQKKYLDRFMEKFEL